MAEGWCPRCYIRTSQFRFCLRYADGSQAAYNGADLVNDALGGAIAVILQYRLGVFGKFIKLSTLDLIVICYYFCLNTGFLAGSEVKESGTLNAGLRKYHGYLDIKWNQPCSMGNS